MKTKKRNRVKDQRDLILSLGIFGAGLFLAGAVTSLLLGIIGSFLVAGAFASNLEGRASRAKQVLLGGIIFLGLFLVSLVVLAVNGFSRHSCIPEGDCAARYQYNVLEKVDDKVLNLYGGLSSRSK